MELRDFFTPKEIEEMKKKVIDQACQYSFLVTEKRKDNSGDAYEIKSLEPMIKREVQDTTVRLVKDYVEKVIEAVVKERVGNATNAFAQNLVDQLTKITEKTNWYWSIK